MAYGPFDTNGGNSFEGGQIGTVIDNDDAFSMHTSLRLTIKLGPGSIMEPQQIRGADPEIPPRDTGQARIAFGSWRS